MPRMGRAPYAVGSMPASMMGRSGPTYESNRVTRIVHLVCSDRFAGVERYIAYVAPALAARGHDVAVIGGHPTRMVEAMGPGVDFHPAATSRHAAVALARVGRHHDIVHAHMTDAEAVAVLLRPVTSARVVATLHFTQPRGGHGLKRVAAQHVGRKITTQIAISEHVAQHAGVSDAVIVPNGVPSAHSPSEEPRDRVVLVAQRFEAEKDSATALHAWAASGLAADGWRLTMAGEGQEGAALRALADSLGIGTSVDFPGRVDDLDVRMAHAAIFLATAPSEPFGLSVVEAMAAGLPVVAADGGAHRETAGRASADVLFPPGDGARAGELLKSLAHDGERRRDVGASMLAMYAQEFTLDLHVDRLEAAYRRTLERR